jgi:hypothetical protein
MVPEMAGCGRQAVAQLVAGVVHVSDPLGELAPQCPHFLKSCRYIAQHRCDSDDPGGRSMRCVPKTRFATDSPPEGEGFEPSVPDRMDTVNRRRRARSSRSKRSMRSSRWSEALQLRLARSNAWPEATWFPLTHEVRPGMAGAQRAVTACRARAAPPRSFAPDPKVASRRA